jgi:hypothetical protein
MNGGQGGGDDGIEGAQEAEFSVVIDGGIAQGGDLYFHGREGDGSGEYLQPWGGWELLSMQSGME